MFLGRDFAVLSQTLGNLAGRPELPVLYLANSLNRAANQLRKLLLGQVKGFATLFDPASKRQGGIHAPLLARSPDVSTTRGNHNTVSPIEDASVAEVKPVQ